MTTSTRRRFLTKAALGVSVASVATVAAAGEKQGSVFKTCPRATSGKNAARFPKVIVYDQFGQKSWFYEDLIADKLVLVSFTSVKGETHYPVLNNLVKARQIIEDRVGRVGRDVHMYTVTTDPHRDTPDDLKKLAQSHSADWRFLTGAPDDVREILASFNARGSLYGLTWIGNEKTGRWIKKPSQLQPLFIAEPVARLATGTLHKPFLVDMHSV